MPMMSIRLKGHVRRRCLNARAVSLFASAILLIPSFLMITFGGVPNALAYDSQQSPNNNQESIVSSAVNYIDQGFKLQIFYNNGSPGREAAAQILKQDLESLNPGKILITVTGIDWTQYSQLQSNRQLPVSYNGWMPDFADPQDYVQPFYHSGGVLASCIGYSNVTLDAMIDAAAIELDSTLRAQEYEEIIMEMHNEAPYIWTSQPNSFFAGRSWLNGYYFNPMYANLYYYALEKNASYPGLKNPDTFFYGGVAGNNPQYLDPARDYETAGFEVLQNVFENLIWYDGSSATDLVPMLSLNVPTLADKNLSADGLQYTYHIRPGVNFHSNDTLTANDVAFSLERALRLNDPNSPVWMLGELMIPDYYSYPAGTFDAGTGALIGGVNNDAAIKNAIWVKDTYTIQINLTNPAPYFNAAMAYTVGSIVSENNTIEHGGLTKAGYDWVNTNPIGTGPYAFTGFNVGQNVTLQRWDGYWRTPAKIKNVVLQQIADPASRILQLKNGDIDAAAIQNTSQAESVQNVAGITVVSGFPTFIMNYILLNQNINMTGLDPSLNTIPSDFFRDRDVRQAFAHAFDCPTFIQTYLNNNAVQPNGAIPKGMFGYSADVPVYDFNLTLSRELLGSQSDYAYTTSGSPAVATITGYSGAGGAITIPSTFGGYPTVAIGDYAFQYAPLTSVIIPAGVTSIGNHSFSWCTALASVTIPDTVTTIGDQAFFSCTSLTSMIIPNSVTSIGSYTFGSCDYLTSVSMGNNLTTIGYGAFQHCISLASVIIPNSVTTLASTAFSWCNSLASLTIGNNVPIIEAQVFQHCTSLTSVTIPSKVTAIGTLAFESCSVLNSVTIPTGVTSIDYAAFSSCALSSVTIPGSVWSIGEWAFASNPLSSITFSGLIAPTSVAVNWIQDTDAGIRGHAYAASNFPAPGGVWNGLTMGAVINAVPVAPGTPTDLTAIPGNNQVFLTWTAPGSDGGSAITNYNVYRSATETGTYSLLTSPVGLNYTDTSTLNGLTYWYKVSAVNAIGEGGHAGPVPATPAPATAPTAPRNLAAVGSAGSVALTWQAPASTGGLPLTGYKVFHGTTAHPSSTFVAVWPANTSATISGLETGTVYYFNMVAVNIEGNSSASPDIVILIPAPGQSVPSVSSTSTVSDFAFNASKNELTFTVSGAPGTTGKTRVFVPSGLVGDPAKMTVKIDGNTVHHELTPVDGGWALDVTYQHSSHSLVIDFGALPDGQLDSILLIAVSVVAVVIVGGVSLLVFRPKKKKG